MLSITRTAAIMGNGLSPIAVPIFTAVQFSDGVYPYQFTHGFWPHTEAAFHHGYPAFSHIDFSRDLGGYLLSRRLTAVGTQAFLRSIETNGDSILLTWAEPNGALREETWQRVPPAEENPYIPGGLWRRAHLTWDILSTYASQCPTAEMWLLDSTQWLGLAPSAYGFQALVCPTSQAPGFQLLALIPLHFAHDFGRIGEVVGPEHIQPHHPDPDYGFDAEVGTTRVVIGRENPGGLVEVTVIPPGLPEHRFVQMEGERLPQNPVLEEAIERRSEDGDVRLHLVRRIIRDNSLLPGGATVNFGAESMELSYRDNHHLVDGWDALDYQTSHHNFCDKAVARAGDRTLTWDACGYYDPEQNVEHETVSVVGGDGTVLLPPTVMFSP